MLADGEYPRSRAVNPASLSGLHLSRLAENRRSARATTHLAVQTQSSITAVETKPDSPREAAPSGSKQPDAAPCSRLLPQYRVLLHNDDLVEMAYVVRSIVQLTFLPTARAYVVMMTAHTRGVALVTITHRERAELYQQQFRNKGLIVTIEAAE